MCPSLHTPDAPEKICASKAYEYGVQYADHVRRSALKSAQDEDVDPVDVATRLGIRVRQTSLPDHISGGVLKEVDENPVILLARGDSHRLKRFVCAQQIGHYLHESKKPEYMWVQFRNPEKHLGRELSPKELFAWIFAIFLLVPENAIRSARCGFISQIQLADQFEIPPDVLTPLIREASIESSIAESA